MQRVLVDEAQPKPVQRVDTVANSMPDVRVFFSSAGPMRLLFPQEAVAGECYNTLEEGI